MKCIKEFLNNLMMNPFTTAVAVWAVILLIRALLDPVSVSASSLIPSILYYFWAYSYCLGGLLMLFGQGIMSSKIMAVGCVLFAEGVFISAMATLFNPINGYWIAIQSILLGIAALIRTYHLMRGETLRWSSHISLPK
jgi:hypothetical protein